MVEYVEEVGRLMNELDITGEHATEIINIYFDCMIEDISYKAFLEQKVKRFDKTCTISSGYIEVLRDEMDEYGIAYWETNDYLLTTQYDELQRLGLAS